MITDDMITFIRSDLINFGFWSSNVHIGNFNHNIQKNNLGYGAYNQLLVCCSIYG